ncbi:MAG TPA: ATP-binding protein [Bacillota bacterium]|nr:ATP-binding protein [Bacillota bacterium]
MQGQAFITDFHKSSVLYDEAITVVQPIFRQGRVVGVLGCYLTENFFKQHLSPIAVGDSGYVALLDSKGLVVSSNGLHGPRTFSDAPYFRQLVGNRVSVQEWWDPVTKGNELIIAAQLKKLKWYLVAAQDRDIVVTPAMLIIKRNLLVLTLLVLVLFLLYNRRSALLQRAELVRRQNAEKLALVGELAAGMAHEIRNPLTIIKGFTELLRGREKYAEDSEIFEFIGQSVNQIEGIVQETLLLAKPQKMTWERIDLNQLLEETCNLMQNQTLINSIDLKLEVTNEPVWIKGDKNHLKQVLINIIRNAIEAIVAKGTEEREIQISVSAEEADRVRVVVSDTGEGMDRATLDKIGTPFFTRKRDGTGLGLSVSMRIMESHKGVMEVTSMPNKGTQIALSLPLIG